MSTLREVVKDRWRSAGGREGLQGELRPVISTAEALTVLVRERDVPEAILAAAAVDGWLSDIGEKMSGLKTT